MIIGHQPDRVGTDRNEYKRWVVRYWLEVLLLVTNNLALNERTKVNERCNRLSHVKTGNIKHDSQSERDTINTIISEIKRDAWDEDFHGTKYRDNV